MTTSLPPADGDATHATRQHLAWGFAGLALFATVGLVLEGLHAWKSGAYLDVGNETRRLMWRLAHAHGALLSLVNLAFGLAVPHAPALARGVASPALRLATVLLPLGFAAGGVVVRGGDPSAGIAFVPLGALALVVAMLAAARALRRPR